MKRKIFSPVGLYLAWILLLLLCSLISIPISIFGTHPSAQVPFLLMGYLLIIFVLGTFFLSLFIMFYFKQWFKKYWYINAAISLLSGGLILMSIIRILNVLYE